MNTGLPGCHGPGEVWVAHDEIVIKKAEVDALRTKASKLNEFYEREAWRNVCWYIAIEEIRDDLVAKGRRQLRPGETLGERKAYILQLTHKLQVIHELVLFALTDAGVDL